MKQFPFFYSVYILMMLVTVPSLAGVVEIPAKDIQRLVVKGWEAQVKLVASPQSRSIRISGVEDVINPGVYIVEKKGAVVEVHMTEWNSKTDWKDFLSQKRKPVVIEITGPSVPVEVYLKAGSVQLNQWQRDSKLTVLQGKVTATGGAGNLEVNLPHGELQVQQHSGKMKVDQYQGHIVIKNLQGDMELTAFASPVTVEKSKGHLSFNTQNSTVKVLQSAGTVSLENGKGTVNLQQFQGRVDGSTQEGSLIMTLMPDSEIHLRSQSGRVQVQIPRGMGAALNVISQEGDIALPGALKATRTSTERSFRGRTAGGEQKLSINIRSQEGSIVIK